MEIETILYIILAGILALLLALFQYVYKRKGRSRLNILFAFLRFTTIFSVLLLLINPKLEQLNLYVEKPNLIVAIDNSGSIAHLDQQENAGKVLKSISENEALNDKFNVETYSFGETFRASDTLTFSERQTNIDESFNKLNQIYKHSTAPTILITDGNQTYGNDYGFAASTYKQPIYPIILGDTITYSDLKIQQLNVNRYAYLKNSFPVEVILVYNGNTAVNSRLVITKGNTTVYSEPVSFTKNNNSKTINFTLPANTVGVSAYKATVVPINSEKNSINNNQNFAIEVIDQKTKVAIISDFLHPDLGALKKSIESNEQRSVSLLNSNIDINQINDFQLVILYQPNSKFKSVLEYLQQENKNRFVIVGAKTDLTFLNTSIKEYTHDIVNQTESYQAVLNPNYAPFIIDDINFESFPPLVSNYDPVIFSVPFESLLSKSVNSVAINEPLLATFETNGRREAVLFGENIWQWRAQSFINSKSFNGFDDFVGKLVQYLASNKRRTRLNIEYESFYNSGQNVIVKAQFFDKNYVFDTRESLNITVKDNVTGEEKTLPLILKNNNYEVDLNNLLPSEYSFTIRATNENISRSGTFRILEYNVERQFLNANVTKLQQIATNSGGQSYFIDNTEYIISDLLNDNRFSPVQKSNKNTIPLIDYKYLLFLISLSLALEWFLRKYNGLI